MFGGLKKKLKEAIGKFVEKEKPEEKYALEEPKQEAIEEKEAEPEIRESKIDYVEVPKEEKFEVEEAGEYKKIEEEVERIHEKEKQIEEEMGIAEGELKPIEQPVKKKIKKLEEIKEIPEIAPARESPEEHRKRDLQKLEEIMEKVEEFAEAESEKLVEPEIKEIPVEKEEKKEKIGLFRRLLGKKEPKIEKEVHAEPEKRGLLQRVIKRVEEKTLSEEELDEFLKDLNTALLENDVALEVAERICDDVKKSLVGKSVKRGKIEETINNALRSAMLDVMKQEKINLEQLIEKKYNETKQPFLIVFFGFNGTGKTTTIAKFAHKLKKYRPVLAAGDTFRAASIEQIEEHGRRVGVEVVKHNYGSDSAAVIFDAVKHAAAHGNKVVLADTAGRSHSNVNLMDELKKVVRVNKPDLKVLVLDSITGNDIYDQSQLFNEAAGVDAIILTKADVYEKGGSALSASYTIKKPILYLGTGQNYNDLKDFIPEEIVKNLLE